MKPGVVRAVLALSAFAFLLVLPAAAQAQRPFAMDGRVADKAGVLGEGRAGLVTVLEQAGDRSGARVYVAYVDTFSGVDGQAWADQTADLSGLGTDDLLLAVAVKDRAFTYSAASGFPLTQAQLDGIMAGTVQPILQQDKWAEAAMALAMGIDQLVGPDSTTATPAPAVTVTLPGEITDLTSGMDSMFAGIERFFETVTTVVLVFVLVVTALVIWGVVRASRRAHRRGDVRTPGGAPVARREVPLDELRAQANAQLIAADDALKTSTDELGFAQAEFGDEQAAPFQAALDEAKREMAQAYELRTQLTDAEDEAAQRRLLAGILAHTAAAGAALDAQAERFDRLRDLERRAPDVIARLEEQLAALDARRPQAEQALAALAAVYAPSALAPVASAPADAVERLEFASGRLAAGRDDLAAHRAGEAAMETTAAESAVGQAQQLLDGVDRLQQELATAQTRIDAAVAETRQDVAEAKAVAGAGLEPLVATAEAALAAAVQEAGPDGGRDPLAALRSIRDADDALDRALQGVRDAASRRAKAVEALDRTLIAARAEVSSTDDFIGTHRGAVRAGPRAKLAEALRDLDKAGSLGATDPEAAADLAAQAQKLARAAFNEAKRQVGEASGASGTAPTQQLATAALAGILVSRSLGPGLFGAPGPGASAGSGAKAGGGRSGRGGARDDAGKSGREPQGGARKSGGGSLAPASFGGEGTRTRRGGGGRF